MLIALIAIIGILVIAVILFINFYPTFGGDVSEELKLVYAQSENYRGGKFVNKKNVPEDPSFEKMLKISRKFFFESVENGRPSEALAIRKIDSLSVANFTDSTRLIWFGHSAFLLQMNGKHILIDPMLGDVPAPHPWLGENRFSGLPIEIEQLPTIDAVLISHDHYDHLDYESIKKLSGKVSHYYVPLGVGVHLEAWGVSRDLITELDWWQETHFHDLKLVCTPAQHFSGRKFSNGQSTLWSSWVIQSNTENIFFSGDSGYGDHFTEIGTKYGPFDIALMECGQYNTLWPDVHMFPEETAQAGVDLRAKAIMPIHWGGFKLSMHSWTDPIERVTQKASELGIPLVTPRIGESIPFDQLPAPNGVWWE